VSRGVTSASIDTNVFAHTIVQDQGKIIGAIACSEGADSQDEVVSEAGAAVINKLPAGIR
jgi:hypothetical protein